MNLPIRVDVAPSAPLGSDDAEGRSVKERPPVVMRLIRRLGPTGLMLTAALLPLLLAPLRARFLGPSGRGEFAFFQASVMMIMAAAGSGIRHAYYGQDLVGARRSALWTSRLWLPSIGMGLVVGVPLAVVAFTTLGPVVGIGVVVITCGAPVFAFVQLETADAQVQQREMRVAGIASTPACFEFVANIVLLIVRAVSVTTAITITILSEVTRGLAALTFSRRDRVGGPRIRDHDRVASAQLARRAVHFLPATLVPLIAANIDSIVYGALGHTAALGVYSVAKLAPSFLLLAAAVSEGRFIASAAQIGLGRTALRFSAPILGLAALAAVGGAIVVEPLFGQAFAGAAPAFAVTAALGVAGSFYVWLVAVCAQRGRNRLSIWTSLVVLAVGFLGSVALGLTPDPSPIVIGFPVLSGYVLGSVSVVIALRRSSNRARP